MCGTIHEEMNFSKITLFNSSVAMDFMISRAAAGPLVVPKLNYYQYDEQLERT
jgi:hypothetical protein